MNYSKARRLTVFAVCYLSYTSVYIARLNLSVASAALVEGSVLTTAQTGILGTLFAVIYAVGRLINGRLGDKLQPKLFISAGLFLTALTNFILYFLPPYPVMLVLWGINAYGQSMLWGSVICASVKTFGEERAKKAVPVMVSSVATGSILGVMLNAFIVKGIGVRFAFLIPAAIAAFCLVLTAAFIPIFGKVAGKAEHESGENGQSAESAESAESESADRGAAAKGAAEQFTFRNALCDKSLRREFPHVFIHGIIKDNVSFWMTLYFVSTFGIDLTKIAFLSAFIPLAGFVGRIIYPLISKIFGGNLRAINVFSYAITAFASALVAINNFSVILAAACLGLVYAALSVVNTAALSVYPLRFAEKGGASAVSGFLDFCAYSGYGFGTLVFGYMIEPFGYSSVFWAWAVLAAVAAGTVAFFGASERKKR